jgi:hypothetical protein
VRLDPADVLMVEHGPGEALMAASAVWRYGAVRYVWLSLARRAVTAFSAVPGSRRQAKAV